jgi:hypothetical protein
MDTSSSPATATCSSSSTTTCTCSTPGGGSATPCSWTRRGRGEVRRHPRAVPASWRRCAGTRATTSPGCPGWGRRPPRSSSPSGDLEGIFANLDAVPGKKLPQMLAEHRERSSTATPSPSCGATSTCPMPVEELGWARSTPRRSGGCSPPWSSARCGTGCPSRSSRPRRSRRRPGVRRRAGAARGRGPRRLARRARRGAPVAVAARDVEGRLPDIRWSASRSPRRGRPGPRTLDDLDRPTSTPRRAARRRGAAAARPRREGAAPRRAEPGLGGRRHPHDGHRARRLPRPAPAAHVRPRVARAAVPEQAHRDRGLGRRRRQLAMVVEDDWADRALRAQALLAAGRRPRRRARRTRPDRPARRARAAARAGARHMERTGIAVDVDRARGDGEELGDRMARLREEIYGFAGEEFNLDSPKQLQVRCCSTSSACRRRSASRPATRPTPRAAVPRRRPPDHRAAARVPRGQQAQGHLRRRAAAAGQPGDGPDPRRVQPDRRRDRAAVEPAPQHPEHPDPLGDGREIRRAFVAGEGYTTLLVADYSQIELRVMAHLSGDEGLLAAFGSGRTSTPRPPRWSGTCRSTRSTTRCAAASRG